MHLLMRHWEKVIEKYQQTEVRRFGECGGIKTMSAGTNHNRAGSHPLTRISAIRTWSRRFIGPSSKLLLHMGLKCHFNKTKILELANLGKTLLLVRTRLIYLCLNTSWMRQRMWGRQALLNPLIFTKCCDRRRLGLSLPAAPRSLFLFLNAGKPG